jgi:hypothetical protein
MSATNASSVLKSLEIDSSRVEALSEADLCELIGFIEYDSRLHTVRCDDYSRDGLETARRDETASAARSRPDVRPLADASCAE